MQEVPIAKPRPLPQVKRTAAQLKQRIANPPAPPKPPAPTDLEDNYDLLRFNARVSSWINNAHTESITLSISNRLCDIWCAECCADLMAAGYTISMDKDKQTITINA